VEAHEDDEENEAHGADHDVALLLQDL
jgi:hypothetical protein